jgi:beta-glucanase (GH16 family)
MKTAIPRRVLLMLALLSAMPLRGEPPPGYVLKWADEFEGAQLDATKWQKWLPGPRHDAINTPDAVSVGDGVLTITTYTEGGKHYTGMVSTEGLFDICYGYIEARVQWADAPGTWSAFWSLSPTMGNPIGDVAAAGMELDFVEHRAMNNEGANFSGKANFTLHWDGYGKEHQVASMETAELGLGSGFHVYGFEWTETAYRWFIDGKLLWEVTAPISKRPQFLVLSSEVMSEAWSQKIPPGGYGDRATSNVNMLVDYVRYYVKP